MRTICAQRGGVTAGTLLALILSVFTIAAGSGLLLPLLPHLVERLLGAGAGTSAISRNTGFLTASYTLALFLFAPVSGRVSDRRGRRCILLCGLCGFAFTMLVFPFTGNLVAVYMEQFLLGLFSAAVLPVALATIGGLARTDKARARYLTMLSMAAAAGSFLGPMLGVFLARVGTTPFAASAQAGSLAIPLVATAAGTLVAAAAAALALPQDHAIASRQSTTATDSGILPPAMPQMLALAFIVATGIGVFHIDLALRGTQEVGFSQTQVALMFSECSLVMFLSQAAVFSPLVNPKATRWLIPPAIVTLAVSLYLVPWTTDPRVMLAVVGAIAVSAGILTPILTFWISSAAGLAQGQELGRQTAATNLGTTAGSMAAGVQFAVAFLPEAAVALTVALTLGGFILSLKLPRQLVARRRP
ncbi:MAG: MFS transporter [Rhodopila sp.]|nr:MFS transporter [Rhodopila sp.]